MKSIQNIPSETGDETVLHPSYATADITQETTDGIFNNLSIGLAISPKGDQVAIYQEPNIGQWKDEARLPKCSFPIRLFNNPLVMNQDNIPSNVGENFPNQDSVIMEIEGNRSDRIQLVQQESIPHRIFDSFIGYGAFLTEKKNIDCERHSVNTSLYNNP
ncbi:hypothetical protein BGZ65_000051, partial [Modicella reniformis]